MNISKRLQIGEEQSRRVVLVGLTTSLALLLVVCLLGFTATQAQTCDYTIGAGVSTADGTSNYSGVQPGDTVCVSAGTRGPLTLRNFRGASGQPITFINSGGLVRVDARGNWVGVLLQNCEHVRLTGTGDPAIEYGFEVYNGSGIGVNAKDKSRYFEIDHIEVHDVDGQGISSKTDENLRGAWVQYGTRVHHCYLHDVGKEGFYIGSQHYDQGEMPTLEGVEIAYNIIERTGWDGGHVGSCVSDCSIHHNRVYQDSRADVEGQKSGLANGKGSVCDFYANFIKNSGRIGIRIEASGANKVYNNVIVSPGDFAQPGSNDAGDGVKVIEGTDAYSDIRIWNNTIITPKNFGVNIDSDLLGNTYAVQNNIIADPGNLGTYGEDAYVDSGNNVLISNNLKTPDISTVRFTEHQSDDYSLRSDSPAIDAGVNLSSQGVVDDYDGTPRPQGAGYDIGGYEYAGGPQPAGTPTSTPTTIPTSTPTASPTSTLTPTSTSTSSPTASPTSTSTSTTTLTPTVGQTSTPTATPTSTPAIVATATATPTANPNELIIDDSDAGFSTSSSQDSWVEYVEEGGRHYGGSHYYNVHVGTGQDIAVWSFAVPKPGRYEVYAWWWEAGWRPTDVPYTINHLSGSSTIRVNQQTDGGQWNLLGGFDFQGQGSVAVSDDASSGREIVADAIRLVYQGPLPSTSPTSTATVTPTSTPTPTIVPTMTATPAANPEEIIIDDIDGGFSAVFSQDVWVEYTERGGEHYGDAHHYNRRTGTGKDIAVWSFTVPKPGRYKVYAWWWEGKWRPRDVPYTISHRYGSTTVRVNQRVHGGRWNLLGTFEFLDHGSVAVSDDASSGHDVVADAVRLVYQGAPGPGARYRSFIPIVW